MVDSAVPQSSLIETPPNLAGRPAASNATATEDNSTGLDSAIRAYRQVSTLLEGQGVGEVARELDYRASQLARRHRGGLVRLGLWTLDRLTGYGYRPVRVLITYGVAVLLFALVYGLTGATTWKDAIFISLLAFHGRGISPSNVLTGGLDLILPAVEAVVGFFVEALVVAVIIRRLFRG